MTKAAIVVRGVRAVEAIAAQVRRVTGARLRPTAFEFVRTGVTIELDRRSRLSDRSQSR